MSSPHSPCHLDRIEELAAPGDRLDGGDQAGGEVAVASDDARVLSRRWLTHGLPAGSG